MAITRVTIHCPGAVADSGGEPGDLIIEVPATQQVTLSASVDGDIGVTWQWRKGDVNLPGETSPTLNVSGQRESDVFKFTAIATNTSDPSDTKESNKLTLRGLAEDASPNPPAVQTIDPGDNGEDTTSKVSDVQVGEWDPVFAIGSALLVLAVVGVLVVGLWRGFNIQLEPIGLDDLLKTVATPTPTPTPSPTPTLRPFQATAAAETAASAPTATATLTPTPTPLQRAFVPGASSDSPGPTTTPGLASATPAAATPTTISPAPTPPFGLSVEQLTPYNDQLRGVAVVFALVAGTALLTIGGWLGALEVRGRQRSWVKLKPPTEVPVIRSGVTTVALESAVKVIKAVSALRATIATLLAGVVLVLAALWTVDRADPPSLSNDAPTTQSPTVSTPTPAASPSATPSTPLPPGQTPVVAPLSPTPASPASSGGDSG